jgi:hypothetical protein
MRDLQLRQSGDDPFRQFRHALTHQGLAQAGLFGQLLEVSGGHLRRRVFAPDLHGHVAAQLGIAKVLTTS